MAASFLAGLATADGAMRAGLASRVITPLEPMWAAGYASRNQPVAETEHDLWAKALALEDEQGCQIVLVTTDLLGFPRELADRVARAVEDRYGVRREALLLSSSHTHSGPVLRNSLVDIYPMGPEEAAKVAAYTSWLEPQLVELVGEALARREPAELAHGVGRAGFAMNRRQRMEQGTAIGVNPQGPVDHDVPLLRISAPGGQLRAIFFSYACHCTTLDSYRWCGDYAGFAQIELEAAHPGALALFAAGCGADANPHPRRSMEICREHGHALAQAVEAALAGPLRPVSGPLAAAWREIDLAFAGVPSRAELEAQIAGGNQWEQSRARRYLALLDRGEAIPAKYAFPIQTLRLGDDLTLVALAGEVVAEYSLSLKRELAPDRTWVIGYANDVFAYIPTETILAEGGYEGDSSMAVYGLPARWAAGLERQIVDAASDLARRTAAPRAPAPAGARLLSRAAPAGDGAP